MLLSWSYVNFFKLFSFFICSGGLSKNAGGAGKLQNIARKQTLKLLRLELNFHVTKCFDFSCLANTKSKCNVIESFEFMRALTEKSLFNLHEFLHFLVEIP